MPVFAEDVVRESDGANAFVVPLSRSALDTLAGSSGLTVSTVYRITDEGRLAVALTTSTYEAFAKESEAGWELIASATPTGTNVVEFNDIPTHYNELRVTFIGLSSTSSMAVIIDLSADGTNWTSGSDGVHFSVTDRVWGVQRLYGVRRDFIFIDGNGSLTALGTNNTRTRPATNFDAMLIRCDGGVTDLRVRASAGNFDAGTIYLEGTR